MMNLKRFKKRKKVSSNGWASVTHEGVQLNGETRATLKAEGFTVKRIAFGYDNATAALERIMTVHDLKHIGNYTYGHHANVNYFANADETLAVAWEYESGGSSALYVVVENAKAYKALRAIATDEKMKVDNKVF